MTDACGCVPMALCTCAMHTKGICHPECQQVRNILLQSGLVRADETVTVGEGEPRAWVLALSKVACARKNRGVSLKKLSLSSCVSVEATSVSLSVLWVLSY